MTKSASAVWTGAGKTGQGKISTQAGALKDTPYGFTSRFESGAGTNPEELIGAAHAGCFTMALAFALEKAGFTAERLETKADVTLDKDGEGFKISRVDLTLNASVPGIAAAEFTKIAEGAKANCPVSKVLNAEISLTIESPRVETSRSAVDANANPSL